MNYVWVVEKYASSGVWIFYYGPQCREHNNPVHAKIWADLYAAREDGCEYRVAKYANCEELLASAKAALRIGDTLYREGGVEKLDPRLIHVFAGLTKAVKAHDPDFEAEEGEL